MTEQRIEQTEENSTQDPVDDVQETDATDQDGTDTGRTPDEDDESTNPNKEAAKYRHRLRDTEAQIEELKTQHQAQIELLQTTLEDEQWKILDAENQSKHSYGGPNYYLTNEQLRKMGITIDQFTDTAGRINKTEYRKVVQNLEEQLGLRTNVVGSSGQGPETPEQDNNFARKLAGRQYQD